MVKIDLYPLILDANKTIENTLINMGLSHVNWDCEDYIFDSFKYDEKECCLWYCSVEEVIDYAYAEQLISDLEYEDAKLKLILKV